MSREFVIDATKNTFSDFQNSKLVQVISVVCISGEQFFVYFVLYVYL